MNAPDFPRCRTCAHWDAYKPDDDGVLVGAGNCRAVRAIWDVTEYNDEDPLNRRELLPEHAAVLAVVEDGSGYAAGLITMRDFGCVMHKPK